MLSVEVGGNHRYWAATESDTLENEFIDNNCQHFLKLVIKDQIQLIP